MSNPVLFAFLLSPVCFAHMDVPWSTLRTSKTWQRSGIAQNAAVPLTCISSPPTFFSSLLFSPVDVVLELDADLPFVGLVSDEGVLHQLLRGWSLAVVLH